MEISSCTFVEELAASRIIGEFRIFNLTLQSTKNYFLNGQQVSLP